MLPKEITDYIASYGGAAEELSSVEIEAVTDEYKRIQNGESVLDSVLFGRFSLYR